MKKIYKERRIYFSSKCSHCGKPFQSYKRSKIKKNLCRNCRRNQPVKGQLKIV